MERVLRTLSELAGLTGVKRRTLQLWSEAGALRPENGVHGGRGVHRVFDVGEVWLAMVLARLHDFCLPIATMVECADAVRRDVVMGSKCSVGIWRDEEGGMVAGYYPASGADAAIEVWTGDFSLDELEH